MVKCMKVNIGGYEVSISAKYSWMDKASKHSTLEFLNYLSIIFDEASASYANDGYDDLKKACYKIADDLYNFNNEHGLYTKH